MSQKINFSDYKAAGVYFLEFDNSVITGSSVQSALRLAVGFNNRGPFNRPVYVADTGTADRLFGGIDRKLERRGCFTNRFVRTMLNREPVYVLNLLNVDTNESIYSNKDRVGYAILRTEWDASWNNKGELKKDSSVLSGPYAFMYDRTRFWVVDDDEFKNKLFVPASKSIDASAKSAKDFRIEQAALLGLANCGTRDLAVIVRKSENVRGYNLTFRDYYGSDNAIPYRWINPNDYISDYFVDVYAISGTWSDYQKLSTDPIWKAYFDVNGLKKDMLGKFLSLSAVNLVGSWTGSVLPNFVDAQGNTKSIDYLINRTSNETGLMFTINEKAYDALAYDVNANYFIDFDGDGSKGSGDSSAYFVPDFVGHTVSAPDASFEDTSTTYHFSSVIDASTLKAGVVRTWLDSSSSGSTIDGNILTLKGTDASTYGDKISVGDFLKGKDGFLVKVVKKQATLDASSNKQYVFTASNQINDKPHTSGKLPLEYHKPYSELYSSLRFFNLSGLKITSRHQPGFDSDGNINYEAGVEKIYSMLINDEGIRRGLLNNDTIDFRYIIDTMGYGLGANCGGKKHLSDLANRKFHCTAIISAPSMSSFAASDMPFFGDTWDGTTGSRPQFNVKYIPMGGNQDMVYGEKTEMFSLPDTSYGADHAGVFGPYLRYREGNRVILIPPAADISNTFMNKFLGGDPYKTVANRNGVIVNPAVEGVEYDMDDEERGYFEEIGINPLIFRAGRVIIYGDKTAYQIVDSDLSYLHCRELLNTIQIVAKGILDDYPFTYNDPVTRAEIVSRLTPFLSAMKDSGALVRFEIQCDEFNNTKDMIDQKICEVDIAVWMTQNMEKIIVPITINRSTTA